MLLKFREFATSTIGILSGLLSIVGAIAIAAIWVAKVEAKADVNASQIQAVMSRQDRQGEFMIKQSDAIGAIREDTARTKVMVEILLERSNHR